MLSADKFGTGTDITAGSPPPSLLALAKLSKDTYNATPVGTVDQTLSGPVTYSLVPGGSDRVGSFEANAYVSADGSQVVIAFRGTMLNAGPMAAIKNALADISFGVGDVNSNLHAYVQEGANFVRSIQSAYHNATITLTGHSLGGAIAQAISAASGLSASVFNAPGAGQIDSQLQGAIGSFTPANSATTYTNTDYRIYGDQVSLVGAPITGSNVTTIGNQGGLSSLLDFTDLNLPNRHSN